MSFSKEVKEELLKNKNSNDSNKNLVKTWFLNSGYISNPNKEYNLQIIFDSEKNALKIKSILDENYILSKIIVMNLYIKEGEEISKFLAFIGVSSSVLKFEETRVLKDMRNNVNRIVNCETSNLNKTIKASVKQIQSIKYLKKTNKFNLLEDDLKEVAEIRIKNPDDTLQQIAKKLKIPITKSGISHRMHKIISFAKKIGENE